MSDLLLLHARRGARLLPALAILSTTACNEAPLPANPAVSAEIGEPLPGLTPEERARFDAGRALFAHPFSPEEGLGPRFNENACNACHTFPADGGTGETSVRKATHSGPHARCDPLVAAGGENLRRSVTPLAASLGAAPPPVPDGATHEATFIIPFVFGLGLVDAVPLEALEALADPDDRDGDGISGRLGTDPAGRPARFGRKADVATLVDFVDGASRLEMGLTTPLHPTEARAGALPAVPDGSDPTAEPELDAESFALLLDFLRFLAPPAPAPPSDDPLVAQGEALFAQLGCAACHVPELRAGPAASAAIADQSIALFSDLLLHDMGPGLAGTCGPTAATTEYRTEPLMGLRHRRLLLHDGRALAPIEAILQHGGEAQAARDAFAALDRLTQEALLRYLATL